MFEIFIRSDFASAHQLRNYPGNCERMHGHNWNVEVGVKASGLNEIDVGIDFRDVKKAVSQVLTELDHRNLNELPAFQRRNPSSERIAEYIFGRVKEELRSFPDIKVVRVTVCETDRSGVTYTEE
jgi:6-pyruvoyltetrahydropterin/6-carboxytetrahydropterin synthase